MISFRHVLLLTPAEGFIFGCACILGALWFLWIMVFRLPLLLRDTRSWCQAHLGQPGKIGRVYGLMDEIQGVREEMEAEHRRRRQLEAAMGRRVS